ncbi:MAG: transcriptional repressor [Anaerolineales bacterium]|nr:transcriptional repressor [Anaerolineales bacterium]
MTHCQTILEALRQRGYRITPQREMIIQVVSHSPVHITAEEVAGQLREHTQAINIATVYRTLDLLWQEGFALRNDLGEGRIVYSTVLHGPHIHLVCRKCNKVIDADIEILNSLSQDLQSIYNFQSDLDHFSIFGVCSDCQNKGRSK